MNSGLRGRPSWSSEGHTAFPVTRRMNSGLRGHTAGRPSAGTQREDKPGACRKMTRMLPERLHTVQMSNRYYSLSPGAYLPLALWGEKGSDPLNPRSANLFEKIPANSYRAWDSRTGTSPTAGAVGTGLLPTAQGFDGFDGGGADGGIEAEDEADGDGDAQGQRDGGG